MRNFLLCLLICMTVIACGTKGDLYIPEQRYPQDPESQNPAS